MLSGLIAFADRYKAIPMFLGGVLAFGTGSWKAHQLLLENSPPVTYRSVVVNDTKVGGRAVLRNEFVRNKVCPLVSRGPNIIDSTGVLLAVKTTAGTGLTQGGPILRDTYRILIPDDAAPGMAVFHDVLSYVCDGKINTVAYPANINFCIAPRDDRDGTYCKFLRGRGL